jgi:hypothetical protein
MNPHVSNQPAQPSWQLLVCTWLVIAGCIVVGSGFLGTAIADYWDPMALFGGVLFLIGSVVVGVLQYVSTYRQNKGAAEASMGLLAVLAALLGFLTLAIANDFFIRHHSELSPSILAGFAGLTGGCVFLVYASWHNRAWRTQLSQSPFAPRYGWRLSLREAFGILTVLGISIGVTSAVMKGSNPQFSEHLETDNPPFGIPVGAKDICFAQGGWGFYAYEFTIDETRFCDWVRSRNAGDPTFEAEGIQPIDGSFRVCRYKSLLPGADGVDELNVTDGLYYAWAESDAGRYFVFDRQTNRAYYQSHSH